MNADPSSSAVLSPARSWLIRLGALAALTAACALWSAAALHGGWVKRLETRVWVEPLPSQVSQEPPQPPHLPWSGGEAARAWVRQLMVTDPDPHPKALALLRAGLGERPLDAPTWLDWAELRQSVRDQEGAARAIALARALWPGRPPLLRRAAWLQVGLGPPEHALDALMHYWSVAPSDSARTLSLARRLSPTAGDLVAAAHQVWRQGPSEPLVYQRELLNQARRAQDLELAQSLWDRLDPASRALEVLLFPYLQLLAEQGHYTAAERVWSEAWGDPPGVVNGGFEEPLAPLGPDFQPGWATPGWRHASSGEGFRITIDSERVYAGRHSLRIDFAGTHNVNLGQPTQIMRVAPGGRYRLTGQWAADELGTRSGVFIELDTVDTQPAARVQTEPRRGSWDWAPIDLQLDVPDTGLLLVLRVRRAATNAIDRHLAGTLWLDDFALTRLP